MTALRWLGGLAAMMVLMGITAASAMAQSITFAKDAVLRSEPRFDAAALAQIKQGTAGEASTKQGPWLNIKTSAGAGWALTTEVSFGAAAASTSAGGGLGSLFGRPRQSSSTTATIGIRGFDKETIGNALGGSGAVSTQQLALLDSFAAGKDAGQAFASGQGLQAASIDY